MKVNYTLPGLLPEPAPRPATELGESPVEPFGVQLQRLRAPVHTDWRAVLRLNTPPAGAAGIGPPPAPHGIELRDSASQRAWWRGMLDRHTRLLGSRTQSRMEIPDHVSVQRMLSSLLESQRLEDQVFARHFAEAID